MPFSQLVALMKANTGRVRLFVAVICRPFAMDECFSSSDGAKLRVDGRDSFPSPSLRAPRLALLLCLYEMHPRRLADDTGSVLASHIRAISPFAHSTAAPTSCKTSSERSWAHLLPGSAILKPCVETACEALKIIGAHRI